MRYILTANAVIAILNDQAGRVSNRLHGLEPAEVGVSAVVMHELDYGAYKSQRRDRNLALVEALRFEVLPLDNEDAHTQGRFAPGWWSVHAHRRLRPDPGHPQSARVRTHPGAEQ
jgi:predicted nucleic acid-binding protein